MNLKNMLFSILDQTHLQFYKKKIIFLRSCKQVAMTQKEVENFEAINNHRRNGKCSQKITLKGGTSARRFTLFHKNIKEELILLFYKFFQMIKKVGKLSNFSWLVLEHDINTKRKISSSILIINIDAKIQSKLLARKLQQSIEGMAK